MSNFLSAPPIGKNYIAFITSTGIESLNKILKNLNRIDLLEFGDKKIYKYMKIGKWDVFGKSIDYKTVVPK